MNDSKFLDYPKWKYHPKQKPTIVNSEKEEKELGEGWENSPAYFDKEPKKKVKKAE